jgi:hypothetical protein
MSESSRERAETAGSERPNSATGPRPPNPVRKAAAQTRRGQRIPVRKAAAQTRRGQRIPVRKVAVMMLALTVVILAFVASYASALGKPSARHIPIAVMAAPAALAKLDTSPELRMRPVHDPAQARRLVEDRAAYGALLLSPSGPTTVLVANGGGHAIEAILVQLGQRVAQGRGTPLTTVDVAPTTPADPNGSVEFYCIVFLGLGGAVGASVLGRILGPVRDLPDALRRLGLVALYAALLSAAVTLFTDVAFGALVGHFGSLFLTMWLFVLAVCVALTGFAALVGPLASGVLILGLVLFGNPSSGGAVPGPLLNSFYGGLGQVLPQGAAMSALRGVQYFGNRGIGGALLCLAIWAAAGLALLGAALGSPRGRAAAGPSTAGL